VASNGTSVELTWEVAGMFVTFSHVIDVCFLYSSNLFTTLRYLEVEIE
jgi:hypothetical protein